MTADVLSFDCTLTGEEAALSNRITASGVALACQNCQSRSWHLVADDEKPLGVRCSNCLQVGVGIVWRDESESDENEAAPDCA